MLKNSWSNLSLWSGVLAVGFVCRGVYLKTISYDVLDIIMHYVLGFIGAFILLCVTLLVKNVLNDFFEADSKGKVIWFITTTLITIYVLSTVVW